MSLREDSVGEEEVASNMESFPFNFMECTKDLKSDTLEEIAGTKLESTTLEDFVMEMEEEKELMAMKKELKGAAECLERSIYEETSFAEYSHDGTDCGETLSPFLVISL